MNYPLVYVLVINWNGKEHLEECFDSLLTSTYPNVKYILLDNASDDDSVEYIQSRYSEDPRVEILECGSNLGWSGGNNKGMEYALQAKADYIFLLNNDTRTDSEALNCLVEKAESDPAIGALSPKILLYDNPNLINSVGLEATIIGSSWDKGIGRIDCPEWDEDKEIVGVCGAAIFLRTSVLKQTGLLPTDFEIYLDDLDLSLRIWMAGHTIQTCPKAKVWHKFSATMGSGNWARHKYYLNTRNRSRIILRNYPLSRLPYIKFLYMKGECKAMGRAFLEREWWRIAAHLKSWIAIIRFFPKDMSQRLSKKNNFSLFWPMILHKPLFFPGTVFPEKGFYPQEAKDPAGFNPISNHAVYSHPGGSLLIETRTPENSSFNPTLNVTLEGSSPITLTPNSPFQMDEAPAGNITITTPKFFTAEESGRLYDMGALIRITSVGQQS